MEALHLRDLVVVYGVGCLVVYVFHRLRQSPVVGFLMTGVLLGPYGFSLISEPETVRLLAELGVMILLFSLGLEFSFKKLMEMRRVVLGTGPIQVGVTIMLTVLVFWIAGLSVRVGVFGGFLLALSSTAIVMRLLRDRAETDSIHGRTTLGILIFQDLCIVPMIVVTPLLVGDGAIWTPLARALGLAAMVVVGVILTARYLFPWLLERIVQTRSLELLTITSVVMLLGTAWVTAQAGFSLALGAFLAGLVLSESEYSHLVFANIRPLQDSLNSLFFISIGMLVNPGFIASHVGMILLVVVALLAGRALVIGGSVLATGLPVKVALLVGLPMAQIGEFSFVLLEVGARVGLISQDWYQLTITCAVITMMLTPALFAAARATVTRTSLDTLGSLWGYGQPDAELSEAAGEISDHAIICGFGVSGANVASVLKANSLPCLILELNPQTVSRERRLGQPIFLGDCTQADVLLHAGIRKARVMLLVISDPFSSRRAVQVARSLNPEVVIFTRTRYLGEVEELAELGADEIVAEEFESLIELIWRILRRYHLPRELVRKEIKQIRAGHYQAFKDRRQTLPRLRIDKGLDVYSESITVSERSPLRGKRIGDTTLRQQTGVLILGIIRSGQPIHNPGPADTIEAGDLLILIGTKEQLNRAMDLLAD